MREIPSVCWGLFMHLDLKPGVSVSLSSLFVLFQNFTHGEGVTDLLLRSFNRVANEELLLRTTIWVPLLSIFLFY